MFTTQRTTFSGYSAPPLFERVRRYCLGVDWVLALSAGLLVVLGIAFIATAASTSFGAEEGGSFALRQAMYLGLGLVLLLGIQRVDYRMLLQYSPVFYLFCLVLLVGVFFTKPVNGARCWFNLYFIKLQPSELMKPALVLTLAYFLTYRESYKRLSGLAVPLLLAAVPLALILKQPQLGTTLSLCPVVVAMLFAAGARKLHLALLGGIGMLGAVGMWCTFMKDYQKLRVYAWLHPEKYSAREAWQLLQSETAIGSGGFLGKGYGHAAQGGMNFLPERHTDFIFASVSEEGGFIIAGLVMGLMLTLALCGLGIAERTREPAGKLIAVGLSVLLAGQAFVNLGVALGVLPTTGLTLPLVSYGGSALLSNMICVGLLLRVGAQQPKQGCGF